LIAHDRDFLDAVVTEIARTSKASKLRLYTGNYSQFERERAQQLALQQATYVKQQRQIAHLQAFIDRFRAKATKAKQAQSRIKALERMELIAAAHVDSPFSFEFPATGIHARQLLKLDHVTLGYGGQAILTDVDWAILAGARIALGFNGAGKSTLLRAIAGDSSPRRRTQPRRVCRSAILPSTGRAASPRPKRAVALQQIEPGTASRRSAIFSVASIFVATGSAHQCENFPAEKRRLTQRCWCGCGRSLLLDERPIISTSTCAKPDRTLRDYRRPVVVAHDRHLLRATPTSSGWSLMARLLDSDLDDYGRELSGRGREAAATVPDAAVLARPQDASAPKPRRGSACPSCAPLQQKIERIERLIDLMSTEKRGLDEWLATSDAYIEENKERLIASLARRGDLAWELARDEAEWLELHEALERAAG
jgi:ATP-binding cassette subfamily F protein 3